MVLFCLQYDIRLYKNVFFLQLDFGLSETKVKFLIINQLYIRYTYQKYVITSYNYR